MRTKGELRRQQIVDTAKRVMLEHGLDRLVLREIAEQVGIAHGNLQYYFPTKRDLLVAIFDAEVAKYTDSMRSAVAATSSRRGRLEAIVESGIRELRSPESALWRMLMSMADHNADLAAILKKENDLYQSVLVNELKQIAPQLSLQRRRHIAKIVHAILDGLGIQQIHDEPDSADMRALESEIKAAIVALVESG
jgi:AcrR family transcriptional regulator